MNVVDKQEEEEEDDFDDTMTEANSPEIEDVVQSQSILPVPDPQPVIVPPQSEPERETERARNKENKGQERNKDRSREKERDRGHRSERRSNSRGKDDRWEFVLPQPVDKDVDTIPIASRIKIRRKTMVLERPTSPKPAKPSKRRLSVVEKLMGSNRSEQVNETAPNKAKKMRLSSNSSTSDKSTPSKSVPEPIRPAESTPNQSHSSKQSKPTSATSNRRTSMVTEKLSTSSSSSSKPMVTPSTPVKPVNSSLTQDNTKTTPNQRDKKSKGPSTPLITKFFSQTPSLKCDTCPAILNSRNELNFHLKIHKRGHCIKCKETIDNNNSLNSIQKHMISCLFLGNEIPKDYLTHLLKVKVDLNRLTPNKINEIQKSLCPITAGAVVLKKKPGPKSKQRERCNENEKQTEQQIGDKTMESSITEMDKEKLTEKPTDKIDESSTEKTTDKTAEEAKAVNYDGNDNGKYQFIMNF